MPSPLPCSNPFLPITGSLVLQVSATDPDGPDEDITFLLTAGARDNFIINSTTGEIKVAQGANLDRDISPQFEVSHMGEAQED